MAWAPDYASTAELKSYVRISDSADDAFLALAISAASRAVDLYCNRQFGRVDTDEQRLYTAEWDRNRCQWVVFMDDVMPPVTGFTVTVTAGTVDAYDFKPANAAVLSRPYTHLRLDRSSTYLPTVRDDEVTITARWGWTSVPDPVKEATLIQASRFFARKDSPYGIAGSPDLGSELRLLSRVDPDVGVALNPYRRWWAAA